VPHTRTCTIDTVSQCKEKKDKRTPLDDENMEKMEEINFHKIAMRYSNTLTKDVVFSCLREIFTRIGKAMMTGKHVQIFCGVGDFVSRDRKAEFIFDRSPPPPFP
jgi:nucleoid DNA-binding protein